MQVPGSRQRLYPGKRGLSDRVDSNRYNAASAIHKAQSYNAEALYVMEKAERERAPLARAITRLPQQVRA